MADDAPAKIRPGTARDVALAKDAFRMRTEGKDYVDIAKALGLPNGWTQAYKLVARAYGEALADYDKERVRMQEAGRLMHMRALLENRIRSGDDKAMEMDLKYTAEIVEILGLKDGVVSGANGGVAVQVINSVPPWERGSGVIDAGPQNDDGPAPDVVEGEAVEEPLEEPGG